MLLLLITGCGSPISNLVFTEDATFLSALPTDEELAVPTMIQNARVGDEPVLAAAVTELAPLANWLDLCTEMTQAMAETEPDLRALDRRAWVDLEVVSLIQGEPALLHINAAIVRNDQRIDWLVELADGQVLWEGTRDGDLGMTLHLRTLGVPSWSGELQIAREEPAPTTPGDEAAATRPLELTYREPFVTNNWSLIGETTMIFTTEIPFSTPVNASLLVSHEQGGQAIGQTTTLQPITICWDENGDRNYAELDGLVLEGDVDDCPDIAQPTL